MRRLISVLACSALALSLASCGGKGGAGIARQPVAKISPDALVSADQAAAVSGAQMRVSDDGIVTEGNALTLTYVSEPIGAADTVSVSIEQFSDSVTTTDIWNNYEYLRVHRSDMEFVQGIGEDCYIAYPYINVYDRGCYIKISAGSGNNEAQKEALINLATQAAAVVEQTVPAEAADAAAGNIIQ